MARPKKKTEVLATAEKEVQNIEFPEVFSKAQINTINTIEVALKDNTKYQGSHIVFTQNGFVEFKNGKATVKIALAEKLAKLGVI